ncbi:hypothetical protein D3C73_1131370 [compost metagenome]
MRRYRQHLSAKQGVREGGFASAERSEQRNRKSSAAQSGCAIGQLPHPRSEGGVRSKLCGGGLQQRGRFRQPPRADCRSRGGLAPQGAAPALRRGRRLRRRCRRALRKQRRQCGYVPHLRQYAGREGRRRAEQRVQLRRALVSGGAERMRVLRSRCPRQQLLLLHGEGLLRLSKARRELLQQPVGKRQGCAAVAAGYFGRYIGGVAKRILAGHYRPFTRRAGNPRFFASRKPRIQATFPVRAPDSMSLAKFAKQISDMPI